MSDLHEYEVEQPPAEDSPTISDRDHVLSKNCWCGPQVKDYTSAGDEPSEPTVHYVEAHLVAIVG